MINIKKHLVSILFLLFLSSFSLSAQTAAELDVLLETNEISTAKAARFVLGAVQLLPAKLTGSEAEKEAYKIAQSNGWIKSGAEDSISLKDLSFLVIKAFSIKGGLMYSMAKNPRYAYRELIYRKIIQGRSDPAMKVSGQRLLHIIDRAFQYAEESGALDVEPQV